MIRLGLVTTLLVAGWACSADGDDPAPVVRVATVDDMDGGHFVRTTQSNKYTLDLQFEPRVPRMGELFSVRAQVRDKRGVPVESGILRLNARMPDHDHGMETDPKADPGICDASGTCTHPDGQYRSDGFKFHMAGSWTVTVEFQGPVGVDSTSFVYEML